MELSARDFAKLQNFEKTQPIFHQLLQPAQSILIARTESEAFYENSLINLISNRVNSNESYKSILLLTSQVRQTERPLAVHRYLSPQVLIFVLLLTHIHDVTESITGVTEKLINPPKRPLTLKNRDTYIFCTSSSASAQQILKHPNVSLNIRFKMALSFQDDPPSLYFLRPSGGAVLTVDKIKSTMSTTVLVLDIAQNLHGLPFVIKLSIRSSGILLKNDSNGNLKPFRNGGHLLHILMEAATTMNMTCSYFPASNNAIPGFIMKNGTATGVVGDLVNRRADIGLPAAVRLDNQFDMDVATPVHFLSIAFVHGKPEPYLRWSFLLRPLSSTLWLSVATSTAAITITIWSIGKCTQKFNGKSRTFPDVMTDVVASYLNQLLRHPAETSLRLLLSFWFVFVLVISTIYCSKLYDLYMDLPTMAVPSSFDELASSDYQFGMWNFNGGGLIAYLRAARTNSSAWHILQRVQKMDALKCVQAVLNNSKFACIGFDFPLQTYINVDFLGNRTRFTVKNAKAVTMSVSVGLQKGSILTARVNRIFSSLRDAGLMEFWTAQTWKDMRVSRGIVAKAIDRDVSGGTAALGLLRVGGNFIVMAIGLSLASFCFFIEIIQIFWRWRTAVHSRTRITREIPK